MVIQLGQGADRAAARLDGVGLVNGDRRRDPVDAVNLGFVHAVEKLPGVR